MEEDQTYRIGIEHLTIVLKLSFVITILEEMSLGRWRRLGNLKLGFATNRVKWLATVTAMFHIRG